MSEGKGQSPVEEMTIAPLTIDPDAIARFIGEVYDSRPHGKSFVPRWSGPFFKHLIFDHPDFTPDHALGAYQGERLVGLIMAQPYVVFMGSKKIKGLFGSWLAITPEGGGTFTAIKLINELKERNKTRGAKFMVGIAYRSGAGVGLDFWESFMRAFPKDISKGRDLTYWARVLDGKAFAGALKDPLLKVAAHASRIYPVFEPKIDPHIREFQPKDLERCQELLKNVKAQMRTAATYWELQSAPGLSKGPQTLVLDRGKGPEALSMFHNLPMSDAGPLVVGMIDHLVTPCGAQDQAGMLAATMWKLKKSGACLALMPRKPDLSRWPMLRAGFAPYADEFKIFLMPYDDELTAEMPTSFDLLVR